MKKITIFLTFTLIFAVFNGCEFSQTEKVENEEGDVIIDQITIFEDATLGISFEYTNLDNWTTPTIITDSLKNVRSYDLLENANYSLYQDNGYGRPAYDWTIQWSQNMENAVMDPPNCEGDACALLCGDEPCLTVSLSGFDYTDLEALKSAVLDGEPMGEEKFISDYKINNNHIMLIAHNAPGLTLDAYISNNKKSVVMLIPFGFDYDNDALTYTVKENVQTIIDQMAESLKFL